MGSTGPSAGVPGQENTFPGRHYYPSAGSSTSGGPAAGFSRKLFVWAAAALALRGLLALFGI